MWCDMVLVWVDFVKYEGFGNGIDILGGSIGFEQVNEKVVGFFVEVSLGMGIFQEWQIVVYIFYLFGDQVIMFGGLQWQIDVGFGVDLLGLYVGGNYNVICGDVIMFGLNIYCVIVFCQDCMDLDVFNDLGFLVVCVMGQCLGGVDWVGVFFQWILEGGKCFGKVFNWKLLCCFSW